MLEFYWFAVLRERTNMCWQLQLGKCLVSSIRQLTPVRSTYGIWLHGTMSTFISSLLLHCIHMNWLVHCTFHFYLVCTRFLSFLLACMLDIFSISHSFTTAYFLPVPSSALSLSLAAVPPSDWAVSGVGLYTAVAERGSYSSNFGTWLVGTIVWGVFLC